MADTLDSSEHQGQTASEVAIPAGGAQLAGGSGRGQQVGPYLLVERLGGGAMATVYRGVDQRTNRAVAVKVLRPDADAIMRERFRREALTHSNLNHPNIVQILDIGQEPHSGLTYIAMELVDGPNLSEVMEGLVRLSPADAAAILSPIAAALDYSCRQGVIHRDVKPSNVLLRRVHEDTPNAIRIHGLDVPVLPLLSDFGIARALDAPDLTSAGRTIGTPTYMSPEQCADSHEIDGRSDLYSLGAVFYRCVVGRPPFGGTTTQILHAHVYDPLTVPDNVLAGLPPVAIQLLQRSLAKDPALRYADGAAMAADLRHLIEASPAQEAGAFGTGDATATMPVLRALSASPTVNGQTVLVPAPEMSAAVLPVAPFTPAAPVEAAPEFIPADPLPRVVTPLSVPAVAPRRRWIGAALGGVLAALVLIFGGGLALNLLPEDFMRPLPPATVQVAGATSPAPDATATVSPAVAATVLPVAAVTAAPAAAVGLPTAMAAVTAEVAPAVTAATTPSADGTNSGGVAQSTTVSPTAPAEAATPEATPAGNVRDYWAEAEVAYQAGDWWETLDSMTLIRRIDPGYQGATGDQMLFESHVGLAAEAIAARNLDKALEHLNAAVALRPDAGRVSAIHAALQALLAPGTLNIPVARWSLATALGSYARDLLNAGNACAAADQLQAAVTQSPQTSSAQLLAEAQAACERARRTAQTRRSLAGLSGRLLYSTQEGAAYRIYRVDAAPDGESVLLIDNGTQPARQQKSAVVALRNTGDAPPGIALFSLSAGLDASARTLQLTTGAGDAHDAPPSWSADDRTLIFGSTAGDGGPTRIYRIDANGAAQPVDLGLGRDPAWSPNQDRIVFNGVNDAGGEPGLWLMNSDGSNRLRLTDNGNDIRPLWTPDGLAVVFMSLRDGDWEVYRLDLLTTELLQLTDNPAQDGLPTVSPDGRWVAFASDRGGYWRIWVVPSAGGEAQPLITINGVLTNWLEHAIQWIH